MLYFGNIVRIMLGILLIFSMVSPALAETPDAVRNNAGIQAKRGVNNILFGWTDIPRAIVEATTGTKNPVWGLAAGTFNGIGRAFPRTVSGIADIMTLPVRHCDDLPVKPDELNTQIR